VRACPAALVALSAVLAASCGARTGLDGPAPCAVDDDCPAPPDFCGPVPVCHDGFCAFGAARECADDSVCTVDACDPAARACTHVIRDRDGDGFSDGSCGGPDCDDHDARVHPGAPEVCTGGRDEDCDTHVDCSDDDCADDRACTACSPESCDDLRDDDCDTAVDCEDTDCIGFPACCTAHETRCDDARDEDCDGRADCLDEDCATAPTCCVPRPETCDGRDDDCDGVPDDGITCFFLDDAPIAAVTTPACGAAWYSYDTPVSSSANPTPDVRVAGKVVVAVQVGPPSCGGAAVAVIADEVTDGSGGALVGSLDVTPAGAAGLAVSDDPRECTLDAASGHVGCDWTWQPCCTDGTLVGPFGVDFCVTITLSRPRGVDEILVRDGLARSISRPFAAPFQICGRTRPAVP